MSSELMLTWRVWADAATNPEERERCIRRAAYATGWDLYLLHIRSPEIITADLWTDLLSNLIFYSAFVGYKLKPGDGPTHGAGLIPIFYCSLDLSCNRRSLAYHFSTFVTRSLSIQRIALRACLALNTAHAACTLYRQYGRYVM